LAIPLVYHCFNNLLITSQKRGRLTCIKEKKKKEKRTFVLVRVRYKQEETKFLFLCFHLLFKIVLQ